MITRMVMIQFKPDAPPEAYESYERQKQALAKLPYVKRMLSGFNFVNAHEEATRTLMGRVSYPQSLSLWEFEDEAALQAFLTEPMHKDLAQSDCVEHMEWRYVGNLRS